MANSEALFNALTTLLIMLNPPGLAPVFLALTVGMTRDQRKQVALRGSLIAFGILAVFALFGLAILELMGISLGAFRIAGGLLLFWIAFEMIFEKPKERKETTSEITITKDYLQKLAVFPLALPLIAGPGAISATVLLAGSITTTVEMVVVILILAFAMGLVFAAMMVAERMDRFLGDTGRAILTRLLGVLFAALSVQFVVGGIRSTFGF